MKTNFWIFLEWPFYTGFTVFAIVIIMGNIFNDVKMTVNIPTKITSSQPRVTVTSCYVYKVIRDL